MDITEFMREATENKKRGYEIFTEDDEGFKSDAAHREMLKWEHRLSTWGDFGRVRFKRFIFYTCINDLNRELEKFLENVKYFKEHIKWDCFCVIDKKMFIEYCNNKIFYIDEEMSEICSVR
jgi:hypothetical protein